MGGELDGVNLFPMTGFSRVREKDPIQRWQTEPGIRTRAVFEENVILAMALLLAIGGIP